MTKRERAIEKIKLLNQSAFEALRHNIAEAERLASEAHTLAEQIGDHEGVAVSLLRLAEVDITHAKFHDALSKAETARTIAQRLRHQEKEADSLNIIAKIAYINTNYEQSLRYLEEALVRYRAVGNKKMTVGLHTNIGKVMISLGRYEEALNHLQEVAKQFEIREGVASPYHSIGDAYFYLGDYAASLQAYQLAVAHYQVINDKNREASVCGSMCKLFLEMGALDKSLETAQHGLDLLRQIGAEGMAWQFHREIGKVYYEVGNDEAALEAFNKSMSDGDAYQNAIVQHFIAKIYARRKEIEPALNLLLKCHETYREVKNESALTSGEAEIAALYLEKGDLKSAMKFAIQSLSRAQSSKNRSGEIYAEQLLGNIALKNADTARALHHLEKALNAAEEIQAKKLLPELYKSLAEAHKHLGAFEQSLNFFERYIAAEHEVFNEKSDERFKKLQVVYQVDQTKRDAEREKQKLLEIDKIKSRFFANISHEFRTPLTLILGQLADLEALEQNQMKKNKLSVIRRSSSRLLSLINELLDLSKLEAKELRISLSHKELVSFVKGILFAFESIAQPKGIKIEFSSDAKLLQAWIDADKLEKILSNLFANAFKFTKHGKVTCRLSLLPKHRVRIAISDTGIGIPKAQLKHVFDRFYQVDNAYARSHQGTGIGLALVKELVELHKGKIEVQSDVEKGSTFTIELPISREAFPESVAQAVADVVEEQKIKSKEKPKQKLKPKRTTNVQNQSSEIVLVVEDNDDMRAFITEKLSLYRVIEATNGAEGLQKAKATLPDLIISDVMMPEMDGYTLCEKIKTDDATNHIPLILLTAKGSSESKIQGYEFGADDYLLKPFNSRELQARVKNMIVQRKKLRETFLKSIRLQGSAESLSESSVVQSPFIQKAESFVIAHLQDETYGASELAHDVCLSLSQVQRKFKQLTGKNPTEFIRAIRLKKAAEFLRQKKGNVSEAAYSCGFGSGAYFSTAFKKQFGKSPAHFK
ncbi:MAG: tetratricopeptide repeat protein [Chloroherpetonaceae bacterium]